MNQALSYIGATERAAEAAMARAARVTWAQLELPSVDWTVL